VAFSSSASNLLPAGQDTNGLDDVFVRDLWTEQTFLISAPPGGSADGPSNNPFITPDGAYLLFDSLAPNLIPGAPDTNGVTDIFRISLSLPSLPAAELVSLTDSDLSSNGHSYAPNASDDGTIVAFSSAASNLTSNSPNGPGLDIYIRDLVAGTTVMASVNNQDVPADRNISEDQAISGNGRYVTFLSNAHNLDPGDTDDELDVFVFDRQGDPMLGARLKLVSQKFDGSGLSGNGASSNPCISRDGHYVSFTSVADDLVLPGIDTNGDSDLFVRDMWASQNLLVNRGPNGGVGSVPGVVDNGTMTADGRFLTFYSGSTQYGGHDTNLYWDVYRVDRDQDGNGVFDEPGRTETRLASIGPHNEKGDNQSVSTALMATISRNGHLVVFESLATNFAGQLDVDPPLGSGNSSSDVFVRDMRNAHQR
jgi:Tol biopolymer transport system component